jgi:predicted  nucleic acid-binding Zn-ribbon protein
MQQLQQDCTAKDTKIQHLQNECTSLTATAQEATQLLEEVVTAHKAIGEKLETAHQQLQMEEVKRERLVEALKCMQHEYNKVAKAWQDSEVGTLR